MRFDRWDTFNLGFGYGALVTLEGYRWVGLIGITASLLGAFANTRHDARLKLKEPRP